MCELCQKQDCDFKDVVVSEIGFGTTDTIPGDTSTTETVSVGGSVNGTLSPLGDTDWFSVQLVAGETYEFALNGTDLGSGALSDPLVRLYNSSGNQVAFDDDGGPGVNSLLNYTAATGGTFYVAADSYNSNYTGGYTLSVTVAPPPTPADALDWGTQVTPVSGGTEIRVYFAANGETFDGQTSTGWSAYEIQQAMAAFETFEDYIDVTFVEVGTAAAADFQLVQNNAISGLGYFNPPGTLNEGVGVFNDSGTGWNATGGLEQGGYGFITLIHEYGHGLGLAHPHDTGGNSTVMLGVTSPFNSYGDYDLNQGVFTTMSYNDGWQTAPHGASVSNNYGWQGTVMALDVAVLQDKYGANSTFASGDDTYTLSATNGAGTFYSLIWDTDGTDEIEHTGSTAATINLNDATLGYETGGGGFVSYVHGIHGGFTIANGVVIENASGGSGNDTLTGNEFANVLAGNAGTDTLNGEDGNDTLRGGDGGDNLNGGGDIDTADYSDSTAGVRISLAANTAQFGFAAGDTLSSIENVIGSNHADTLIGGSGVNVLTGGLGDDILNDFVNGDDDFFGGAGDDTMQGGLGADDYDGGDDTDEVRYNLSDEAVQVSLLGNVGVGGHAEGDTFVDVENLTGSQYGDLLIGDDGTNRLDGFNGDDTLQGGLGADVLYGALGFDTADYSDSLVAINIGIFRAGTGGTAEGDTLTYIERIVGSDYDDNLVGGGATSTLDGGLGDDTLFDYGGAAIMNGGAGNDTLIGGANGDTINGGDDVDQVRYVVSNAAVQVDLGAGTASGGHAQGDVITFVENLVGSQYGDTLTGDGGENRIEGLNGDDRINGGGGRDFLFGGAGADEFVYDTFNWDLDLIYDFTDGIDMIDVSAIGLTYDDFDVVDTAFGLRLDYDNGTATQFISIANLDVADISSADFIV
jgi:serralysin